MRNRFNVLMAVAMLTTALMIVATLGYISAMGIQSAEQRQRPAPWADFQEHKLDSYRTVYRWHDPETNAVCYAFFFTSNIGGIDCHHTVVP